MTNQTSTSRPEGWWSSDEVAGTEPNTPDKIVKNRRSFDSLGSNGRPSRFGERGITLGSARPVSAIVAEEGRGERGAAAKGLNRLSLGNVGREEAEEEKGKGKSKSKKKSVNGVSVTGSN
jgi:lysosomal acid lipase/cholesteryl ester hydrolase